MKWNFLSNSSLTSSPLNRWSNFEAISQECSLVDPFQNLFTKFWSVNKHGSGEWGLFALYGHEEILKKCSSLKLLVRYWNNFTEMFLEWPLLRNCSGNFDLSLNIALVYGDYRHDLILNKKDKMALNFWEDTGQFFLVTFRKEFTRIALCTYSASRPDSIIPCLLTDQNFANSFRRRVTQGTFLWNYFKIWQVVSKKIF